MFVDIFEKACESVGIAPTRLLVELGIGKSALSNWRRGSEPSNRTKKQIADYLGITVKQLMSGEIDEAPAKQTEADEMAELLEAIRRNPDLKILFSLSKNATPAEVRKSIKIIQMISGDDDGESDC